MAGAHEVCALLRGHGKEPVSEVGKLGEWAETGFLLGLDKLFAQQSQTMDLAERKRIVRQMELRMIDQAWYVTSHWDENYLFAWPEVKNSSPKQPGPTNNSRFIRDIWLAKQSHSRRVGARPLPPPGRRQRRPRLRVGSVLRPTPRINIIPV